MKNMKKFILLLFIAILVSGCATLFTDSNDQVTFTSDPPNIKVYKDTRYIGTTPLTISLKRVGMASAKLNTFNFEKQGYRSQEFKLTTEFNNVALLNNITVVSWLTDFMTGTITQYSPTEYHVILENNNVTNLDDFYKRKMAQEYILLFFDDLKENSFRQGGIHVNNLMKILTIRHEQHDEFLNLLKSNIQLKTTPTEFITTLDRALKSSANLNEYTYL